MRQVILLTGGARSGKSRYALELATPYRKKAYVATAEPVDEEMRQRIARHRQERPASFLTIEAPFELGEAIRSLPGDIEVAVVDCLTVWLGNLMHRRGTEDAEFPEIETFLAAIQSVACDLIIVTNEVGMGIVPHNRMAREFRDLSGELNRKMAHIADQVILVVSGIPVQIKEGGSTG